MASSNGLGAIFSPPSLSLPLMQMISGAPPTSRLHSSPHGGSFSFPNGWTASSRKKSLRALPASKTLRLVLDAAHVIIWLDLRLWSIHSFVLAYTYTW